MAQVCERPADIATAVLPVPKLDVGVGVFMPAVPSPICLPQQLTDPSSRMAQVYSFPAVIATAVLPVPKLDVGVGVGLIAIVVPSPSCPTSSTPNIVVASFPPQQLTDPSSRMTHVCFPPADIATAVLPVPKLHVGVGVHFSLVVSPPPSWPFSLLPQQLTDLSSRMTQVCP